MNNFHAVMLGLVQGLSEFLPISSSGHLALLRYLFGIAELPLLYDVLLHLASLCAVLIVFRAPILRIAQSVLRVYIFRNASDEHEDARNVRVFWLIFVATLLTALLGVGIEFIQRLGVEFSANIRVVSVFFIITACILIATKIIEEYRMRRGSVAKGSYAELTWPKAACIGLAQGLGVLPGISRSGISISAAVLAGLRREEAGEFSFLLAIPAILGATLIKLPELGALEASIGTDSIIIGMLVSFASAYFALRLLLQLVRKGRLYLFAVYLVPLGLVGLFL